MSPTTPQFIKIPGTVNTVGLKTTASITELPGIWPIIDENQTFLNIIAVGNKGGITESINLSIVKKHFPPPSLSSTAKAAPTWLTIIRKF